MPEIPCVVTHKAERAVRERSQAFLFDGRRCERIPGGTDMGVTVREKIKGSGEWWIFINHRGKRKAKKIGNDRRTALAIAKQVGAKLTLGECGFVNEHA
jgi:hypothetical protein